MMCVRDEEIDEQVLVVKRLACGCDEAVPADLDPAKAICKRCLDTRALSFGPPPSAED